MEKLGLLQNELETFTGTQNDLLSKFSALREYLTLLWPVLDLRRADLPAVIPTDSATGYGSVKVGSSVSGRFEMLAFGWAPGGGTPVHDHPSGDATVPSAHCAMYVVDGDLQEEQYEETAAGLTLISHRRLPAGSFMHADASVRPYLHRVFNTEPVEAVSLHIYVPPLARQIMKKIYLPGVGGRP